MNLASFQPGESEGERRVQFGRFRHPVDPVNPVWPR